MAVGLRFEVFHQRTSGGYSDNKHYQADADIVYGQVTLLPRLAGKDSGESIRELLHSYLGIEQTAGLPVWIGDLNLPGLESIDSEIEQHRGAITELEARIKDAGERRAVVLEYAKLVTATGPELEDAVARAFADLGATVTPAKYSQEEFVINWRGEEFLFEVKGISKSVALTHVRQLVDYMLKYQEDTERHCKAVLYGNAWRDLSPALRMTPERPIFPPNVIVAANRQHLGLLSSLVFFDAYCSFKRGERSGESVLDAILGIDGVIEIAL